MNQATISDEPEIVPAPKKLSREEMVRILNEHGVSRLLIVLRDSEYNINDAISAINEHQENWRSSVARILRNVVNAVFPPR